MGSFKASILYYSIPQQTLNPSLSLSASCVMVTGLLLRGVIISLCISSDNFFAQSLIGDAVSYTADANGEFTGEDDDGASNFDLSCNELILCGIAGGGGFGVRDSFVSCNIVME